MTASIVIFSVSIALFSLLCTVVLLRFLIPVLTSHKIGQKIYDIGPRWHKSKEGTPIMGGIAFILPIAASVILFSVLSAVRGNFKTEYSSLLILILGLGNGAIGFIDDYTKLIKKQNQGLKAWQKLGLQLLFSGAFVIFLALSGTVKTALFIPYVNKSVDLGLFYYIFLVLFITGTANAVNLTDGIDGLASSVTAIIALLFTVFAIIQSKIALSPAAASLIGGCAGFLVYNTYPAKIFMGDTGSLFLGGMLAGLSIAVNNPLIIIVAGIIFFIEELSVILQVGYFKLTHGKRLFKMAPIHHHFEKCGWSEVFIVAVFSGVTVLFCVLAWFGL